MQLQHLGTTATHLSLLFEYLVTGLENAGIYKMDMKAFPEWATARLQEAQKAAAAAALSQMAGTADTPEDKVNLDD